MTYKKKKHKKRANFKIVPLILLIIGLLSFIFLGWKFFGAIRHSGWDGNSRLNLVLIQDSPVLLSLDPEEKNLNLISIPEKTYIEVPRGFGSYPVEGIYKLGDLEGEGSELMVEAMQEFFATPVDGWIKLDDKRNRQISFSEEKDAVKKEIRSISRELVSNFFQSLTAKKTNLPILDRLKLWWVLRDLRFNKIVFLDLSQSGILVDETLGEGMVARVPDLEKLDVQTAGFFVDSKIENEHLKIEILNSTGETGLGNHALRLVTNLGGEVINIDNAENEIGQCQIKSKKNNLGSATVQRLAEIFSCQKVGEGVEESRADIVFIIGRGYWEKLNQNF
ncbi:LCP family protein [Candidatus Microgenomates bacterium]|nr:LCP family protein [Candidatus Microgenomates bacterium]